MLGPYNVMAFISTEACCVTPFQNSWTSECLLNLQELIANAVAEGCLDAACPALGKVHGFPAIVFLAGM